MKKIILVLGFIVSQFTYSSPADDVLDYKKFANNYFEAWTATQGPEATKDDIEKYLSLLADDVGHQHFPNDPDDDRYPESKADMREGMLHYRGAHTSYVNKLLEVTYGANAVVIKYEAKATYLNQQGEPASWQYTMLEALELEKGQVSMIRKYSE